MRFVVSGFGPVEFADVELRPVTVFVGPNASGKSYLLYLIWSLLTVEPDWAALLRTVEPRVRRLAEAPDEARAAEEVRGIVEDLLRNFPALFARNLASLLKDVYMVSDLSQLVRKGHDRSEITVFDDEGDEAVDVAIASHGELEMKVKEALLDKIRKMEIYAKKKETHADQMERDVDFLFLHVRGRAMAVRMDDPIYFAVALWHFFVEPLGFGLNFTLSKRHVILPDGRAGILRGSEPLAYSLLAIPWREVPTVSAVDRHFFAVMSTLSMNIANKTIAEVVDFVEEGVGARFLYRREPPTMAVVDRQGVEYGVHRAPSGLRELAPLVYVIRHVLEPGSYLLVEEPEAHLHPDAQSVVARALAMLARRGVRVAFSTHSVHVVDELDALLKLSRLPPEEREGLEYRRDEGLEPKDLAIYAFSREGKVERVSVTEEGIEETALDKIHRELAGRHAKVTAAAR